MKKKTNIKFMMAVVYLLIVAPCTVYYFLNLFQGIRLVDLLNIPSVWMFCLTKGLFFYILIAMLPLLLMFLCKNTSIKSKDEYGSGRWADKKEIVGNQEFVWYDINKMNHTPGDFITETGIAVGAGPIVYYDEFKQKALIDISADHCLEIASTGDGKDRRRVTQLIKCIADHGENLICNDPKKEQYKRNYNYLKSLGYDVYCLDYRDPYAGNQWNPLMDVVRLIREGEMDEAQLLAQQMSATLEPAVEVNEENKIWLDGRRAVISALALSVCLQKVPDELKTYTSVYSSLNEMGRIEFDQNGNETCELTDWFSSGNRTRIERLAFAPARLAMDRTKSSFFVNIATSLGIFAMNKVAWQISKSDFDLKDMTDENKRPMAIFVVTPYETDVMDKLVNIFYNTAYRVFISEAMKQDNGSLKRRIHFIENEFTNKPRQYDIDKNITVGRGANIRYHIFAQSQAQLKERYNENIRDIFMNNCKLKMFMSANDNHEAKQLSETIGNQTISSSSVSRKNSLFANSHDSNKTDSLMGRPLMTPDEIQFQMKRGEMIVLKSRMRPYYTYAPDFSEYGYSHEYEKLQLTNADLNRMFKNRNFSVPSEFVLNQNRVGFVKR